MRNGKNPDQISFEHVGDIERKHLEIHSSMALSQPWQRWILCDPMKTTCHIAVEPEAQTQLLIIVVLNLRRKLGSRRGMKYDSHELNRASIRFFTSSNGTPSDCPVRSS